MRGGEAILEYTCDLVALIELAKSGFFDLLIKTLATAHPETAVFLPLPLGAPKTGCKRAGVRED